METDTIKKKLMKRGKTSKKFNEKIKYKSLPLDLVKLEDKKFRDFNRGNNLILNINRYGKKNNIIDIKENKPQKKQEANINELNALKKPITQIKEKFYFLDNNESLKNIIKNNYNNDEDFCLISRNERNDLITSSYKKEDFIGKYKFIYIFYENKCFRLLFPKYKYTYLQNEEEIIMNELKNSKFDKLLEKEFNIKLKSDNKEYFLNKINNNDDSKFILKLKEIKEEKNNIDKSNTNIININNNDNNNINININKQKSNNNVNKVTTQISNINNFNNNIINFFPLVGLNNVGSTCFMNATLQCLIHIPELSLYFLNEYPKDKNILKSKNYYIRTRGNLSDAYYDVVNGVNLKSKEITTYSYYNSFSPKYFKQVLGKYNLQFSRYEANDSKDLILYLLQTFHEELNYFGDKTVPNNFRPPNNTLRFETCNYFNITYNSTNFSKISILFYGTYENIITCCECNTNFFSYQKFEYISFSTFKYRYNTFDIMRGFEDFESKQKLIGDNKYFCNKCQRLVNAEIFSKILDLPKYLILNIDYGKNKINDVRDLRFDFEIDLKPFLSYYNGQLTKYKLVAVCTHMGYSGASGHYIAYCLNKSNGNWYNFNDSSCRKCDKFEVYNNSPYLLIYEIIL